MKNLLIYHFMKMGYTEAEANKEVGKYNVVQ